jgi:hypothetical protein
MERRAVAAHQYAPLIRADDVFPCGYRTGGRAATNGDGKAMRHAKAAIATILKVKRKRQGGRKSLSWQGIMTNLYEAKCDISRVRSFAGSR